VGHLIEIASSLRSSHCGRIDVFNSTFAPVSLGAGAFANPFSGLVPFDVQSIGGDIYVTYALPGRPADISATEGNGGVGSSIQTAI
jgi:hypothetical protein